MLCCERPDKLGRLAATKTPMDQQRKDYNYAVNTHNILSCQHQVHSVDPYRKRVLPNVLIIFFTRIIVLVWCYISINIYYCECSTSTISLYHISLQYITLHIHYTLFLQCLFRGDLASKIGPPEERTFLLDWLRKRISNITEIPRNFWGTHISSHFLLWFQQNLNVSIMYFGWEACFL